MLDSQQNKIAKVQILRAIAIIGVVFIHTCPFTPPHFHIMEVLK